MKNYKKILLSIASGIVIVGTYVGTHAEKILLNSLSAYPIKIEEAGLNDFQYDFKYLTELLEIGFPKIDEAFPKEQRLDLKNKILDKLSGKDLDNNTFKLELNRYLSKFNNSHTSINVKTKPNPMYPYIIYISHNKWFLLDIDKSFGDEQIGSEILQINGQNVENIEKELFTFIGAENKISRQAELRRIQAYRNPIYLKSIGLITSLTDELKITFEDNFALTLKPQKASGINFFNNSSLTNPITKPNEDIYSYKIYKEQGFAYLQYNAMYDKGEAIAGVKEYLKPWLQPLGYAYLSYMFRRNKATGALSGRYNPKHPVFKEFLEEMVKDINNTGIENLIIDLRYNNGGVPELGAELIYFLTDQAGLTGLDRYAVGSDFIRSYFSQVYSRLRKKYHSNLPEGKLLLYQDGSDLFKNIRDTSSRHYIPKDRSVFNGNIYVFARFSTGSAAAMLTTLLKDNGLATIIGTNVSNNPIGPTSLTWVKLPKTKFTGSIASTYFVRPNKDAGVLLEPDFWVEFSVEDFINGRDPFLDKALELINASK